MKERPMPFNGAMVRAILSGRKRLTRRPCKCPVFIGDVPPTEEYVRVGLDVCTPVWVRRYNMPAQPGDRLWVRETFTPFSDAPTGFAYRADMHGEFADLAEALKPWTPSIHMHRAASRLTLTVTRIGLERVQSITEDSAMYEGAERMSDEGLNSFGETMNTFRAGFKRIWTDVYGAESWERNKWVWVYTFKIAERKDEP